MRELLLNILRKWSCNHTWHKYYESKTYGVGRNDRPYKITHTVFCKKCGKIKQVNV